MITYSIPSHLVKPSTVYGHLISQSGAKSWSPDEGRMSRAIIGRLIEAHDAIGDSNECPLARASRYSSLMDKLKDGFMLITTSKDLNLDSFNS
jgi:hypothetical protein